MDGAGAVTLDRPLTLTVRDDPARPPEGNPVRLWAALRCGGCGRRFTANPAAVPVFTRLGGPAPSCAACWDRRNRLRAALGCPEQERPACYPADYLEEQRLAWPVSGTADRRTGGRHVHL